MGDEFPTKFLVDGIDRLGKSTLIENIQQELGYHLVIHYEKPKLLVNYLDTADCIKRAEVSETDYDESYRSLSLENLARRLYQEETNSNMFELMMSKVPIIFDRTHLGEMVYAPLYRNYPGDYVYNYEFEMLSSKVYTESSDIRMILLVTSDFSILKDDGLSFDFSKKEQEQQLFIDAFNKSKISNKVIVDVSNGQGGYRSAREIVEEALYKKAVY